jgi:hypothetical protein
MERESRAAEGGGVWRAPGRVATCNEQDEGGGGEEASSWRQSLERDVGERERESRTSTKNSG